MTNFSTTVALAAIASSATAFWGTGHLLIARRAQAILEENNQAALSAALAELTYLRESQPDLVTEEKNNPFTECATFADDIKGKGYKWQSDWHFINQPYFDEGGDESDFPDFHMPDTDVLGALTDLRGMLKYQPTTGSTYIEQIAGAFTDYKDQRSFALRMLIHYVGDIHQPLHSAEEVDSFNPKGDEGGNEEYVIPAQDGVSNMHGVWDSVIYSYTGYPTLPLSDSDWDWYSNEIDTLATKYPISSADLHAGDFQTWADEDVDITKSTVFSDDLVIHNQKAGAYINYDKPNQDYMDKALPICQQRLMLAGARLAALIEDIYGGSSKSDEYMAFVDEVLGFMQ